MKPYLGFLLVSAVAGGLAACAVGPNYQRPLLEVPASFRSQPEPPAAASLGDAAWWEIYRDKDLQQLLHRALANNRDVRIAAARVAEARATLGVAKLAEYPQADLALGASRSRSLTPGGHVSATQIGGVVQISFEVDFWQRLASLSEAARADLLATQLARDNVRVSLIGDVATAYFTLRALDQQLRIGAATVATRQRFFELTRSKFQHGAASGLDMNRAEASLAQARASLPDLRRQMEQTENQLQILLGRNAGPILRQPLDLQAIPEPPQVPAGLPSALLERRPDLRQAEANLMGVTARLGATRAELFPSIALTGSAGLQSAAFAGLFSGPAKVWSFGLTLLQPILNANRSGYRVDAAQARADQAVLQYQQAVAQAFREVSDALIARRDFADFQTAQEQQVTALRAASRRVLRRYEVGYASYFEVVDAERDLFAAELQLVQAYRNSMVALVQLYKALGGGWDAQPAGMLPLAANRASPRGAENGP